MNLDRNEVMNQIIRYTSRPVTSLPEVRERNRLVQEAVFLTTGAINEEYWTIADMAQEWMNETDAKPEEQAISDYENLLNLPEFVNYEEPENDYTWMAERSSFTPKESNADESAESEN